ncbi:carbamoyltransferase family protein [Enterovibrio nigricans]|uniref:Carbamoyltransferase n=1 Tax=Enterovibrio nigricans DSM 22720 TaxID=1121868 RepID=A0A1T4VPH8_9GAMM|nr:carbamoyltransferase C-terminal domain-containing protein [Enterovibrio nigricans]SKA66819.1 carbamoyltransferase [Enterovibrio nigricans DSM 22720]
MYLGISCTGHDNALALVNSNGQVLYAQAVERDTQTKQGFSLAPDQPHKIIRLIKQYAPEATQLTICKSWPEDTPQKMAQEIQRISLKDYDEAYRDVAAIFLDVQMSNMNEVFLPNIQMAGGGTKRASMALNLKTDTRQFDHHSTHAAFACYSSPFDEAACLVMDGYAEDSAQSIFIYKNNQLEKLPKPEFSGELNQIAASLGIFYGVTVCRLCGFAMDSGEEWKVMGLAPYGKLNEEVLALFRKHITVKDGYVVLPEGSSEALKALRQYARPYAQFPEESADIAFTAQYHFSEMMGDVLTYVHDITGMENIVITGGCGLNSSFNGRVIEKTPFKDIFVPCAPGDDGNAVGAALLAVKQDFPEKEIKNINQSPYLGDAISEQEVENFIEKSGITSAKKLEWEDLYPFVADKMANGSVVAWVQGHAEFGPRALGHRSILADSRTAEMKTKINAAVKFREPFRPFAPMILADRGDEYFENYHDTPYMEKVATFKPLVRETVAAVCHADNTGRLQSVTKERNVHVYRLIEEFEKITGVPVIINTSLNVMGKPIVSSLNDAVMTFFTTDIEILVIGQYVFTKPAV